MGYNLLTKCLLGIFVLQIFLHTTNGQGLSEPEVIELIESRYWNNGAKRDELVRDVINDLDINSEFENLTGITVGAVIAIFIILVIVPNLVILLLIFLCCFCCKCGVFSEGKRSTNNYYSGNQANPSYAPVAKPIGPAVPPKPNNSYSPSPSPPQQQQNQPSSGMWPWGKEETTAYNRQSGIQNQGYNGRY